MIQEACEALQAADAFVRQSQLAAEVARLRLQQQDDNS
jgi:hypothetical protein